MKKLQCALVGMHFRPPARQVLQRLSGGTQLRLQRDRENPYDPNAVQVWCSTQDLASWLNDEEFEAELNAAGSSREELFLVGEIQLGFLGASAKLIERGQVSNVPVAKALDVGRPCRASLTMSLTGKPSVLVVMEEEQE